jgi:DNA-binding transcriptional ArsR family regulator
MAKQNFKQKESYILLAEALKSMGHPERIAIVDLICRSKGKTMTVKNIYESLKMEQPIVSRHLGILKRCGILERETEGVNTLYCLRRNNKMVEQIYKMLVQ